MIISGRGDKSTEMYTRADRFVQRLKAEDDYTVDEKMKAVTLTEEGRAQGRAGVPCGQPFRHRQHGAQPPYQPGIEGPCAVMKRDVDYVVQERRGYHRRRVYRTTDDRAPVQRGPAPGD